MKRLLPARTWDDPPRRLSWSPEGLHLEGPEGRRLLYAGPVEEAACCLDASLAPCALLLSRGQLHFVSSKGTPQILAPQPSPQPWHDPLLCDSDAGLVAVCSLGEGEGQSLVLFVQNPDGTFRGRRLLAGSAKSLALVPEGASLRLYLGRRAGGLLQLTSLDPLAASPVPRAEFSAPEPVEELQLLGVASRCHYAFLSQGTLFADGIPLSHGEGAKDLSLAPADDTAELSCSVGSVRRTYRLAPGGWKRAGEEPTETLAPVLVLALRQTWLRYEAAPAAIPVVTLESPAPAPAPEGYRELLSNQARLLLTLREKQELQQRSLFALNAKVEAQSAAMERLRQRCEALQTALQALESLYRR